MDQHKRLSGNTPLQLQSLTVNKIKAPWWRTGIDLGGVYGEVGGITHFGGVVALTHFLVSDGKKWLCAAVSLTVSDQLWGYKKVPCLVFKGESEPSTCGTSGHHRWVIHRHAHIHPGKCWLLSCWPQHTTKDAKFPVLDWNDLHFWGIKPKFNHKMQIFSI